MFIKFFVLVFSFCEVNLQYLNYCELCSNHTLCKYKNPGPSNNCLEYDKNGDLTERDIRDILKRINYRRNYVALQNMKRLPGAANMRKMEWSSELALIAQRWADQCDPNTFPDKSDECRDTGDYRVGQNIATITGLSTGVNVKTFIDIWFIESLQYSGTVVYYDQSRDNKTNYFTQLIWAETDKVGCGRVRFYIDRINSGFVERLVCNFAPKGNVHGKPVYIVGFPATQCPNNMIPDPEFNGLCTYNPETKEQRFTNQNNVRKHKLQNRRRLNPDHGINGMKYKNFNYNLQPEKATIVAIKRSNAELYDEQLSTKEPQNNYRPEEKGHSRLHNNHNHRIDFDPIHPNANQDWKNYEALVTTMPPPLNQNDRRNYFDKSCTRKYITEFNIDTATRSTPYKKKLNLCTRGQKLSTLFNLCPCYTQKNQCTSPTIEKTTCNSDVAVKHLGMTKHKNIVARRGNFSLSLLNNVPKIIENGHNFEDFYSLPYRVSKPVLPIIKINTVLSTPSYSERLRRETEPYTSERFWKINHPNKQLKELRYTTISNRKNKKRPNTPQITQTKSSRTTEFITISKDPPVNNKPLTEKYLSFDELLHLRKSTTENMSFRRGNKESAARAGEEIYEEETKPANLPNYTLTTGFTHVKYCTRKLTCTWTAAFLTDADGNPKGLNNAAGIGNAYGSRTPPGYVEGCTRTSTCTRDFMYRNKGAELSTVSTVDPNAHDDEDYCERRSLNKRHVPKQVTFGYNSKSILNIINKNSTKNNLFSTKNTRVESNRNKTNDNKVRTYRNVQEKKESAISYGELYYLVVKRLLESWKSNKKQLSHKKCMCSYSSKTTQINLFIYFGFSFILQSCY